MTNVVWIQQFLSKWGISILTNSGEVQSEKSLKYLEMLIFHDYILEEI